MITFAEPEFAVEKELENAIANAIRKMFKDTGGSAVVLTGFGLDIAVFGQKSACRLSDFLK